MNVVLHNAQYSFGSHRVNSIPGDSGLIRLWEPETGGKGEALLLLVTEKGL